MGKIRRMTWEILLTVGSWMIRSGRWVHELGQSLDNSPKMDLDELIGGVDVMSTPFGDITIKDNVLRTIRPNDLAPEITQFQQVTDELRPRKVKDGAD